MLPVAAGSSREQFGPYVVYEQLGKGGMATVHRAEMRGIAGFRRQVALKRLLPEVAADPNFVQAFVDEARLAAHLRHMNIAQVHDLGKFESVYFIAMEYIAGPTLMQVLRQCSSAAGPVPVPVVLHIVSEVCDALDYAHNLKDDTGRAFGIIHRDVSPSNVIVSNTGVAKLIDFGIAKANRSDAKTFTGIIKGKFGYIAPEYLEGRIDSRADLFGLGVITHELLCSRSLFACDDDFETLKRIREMPVAPPSQRNPEVPHDVDDIVMTALNRDPDRRWQTASAMRTALTNCQREIGELVMGKHVVEWLDWAFSQVPRRKESSLSVALGELDEPSLLIELPKSSPGHRGGARAATPPVTQPGVEPTGTKTKIAPKRGSRTQRTARPGRRTLRLFLLLLLVIAATGAAWYYKLVPMPGWLPGP